MMAKRGWVYPRKYRTVEIVNADVFHYIELFNNLQMRVDRQGEILRFQVDFPHYLRQIRASK